jgi:hypothetical protein
MVAVNLIPPSIPSSPISPCFRRPLYTHTPMFSSKRYVTDQFKYHNHFLLLVLSVNEMPPLPVFTGFVEKKSLPSLVMSGLNQHGNEASVFYQKTWLRAFLRRHRKRHRKRRAVVSVLACFLNCQWGFVKKKRLLSLVMSGLNQHGNDASVFYQKTW